MRALTESEHAILEAFKDRDVFSGHEAGAALGRRRYWRILKPMIFERGWIEPVTIRRIVAIPKGRWEERSLPGPLRDFYRVTAKGRRALRDGGIK